MNTCEAISPATLISSNKRAAACDLGGEMVILHPDSGVYFGLNQVGAAIWNFIQADHSVEDLVLHLMNEYSVSRPVCEAEVVALLQALIRNGLASVLTKAGDLSNGEAA